MPYVKLNMEWRWPRIMWIDLMPGGNLQDPP